MTKPTYRDGNFWVGDRPYFMVAAEYAFCRERRADWRDRLTKLRDAAVNTITFYIPWRHHLQLAGEERWFDFEGQTKDSRDLRGFLETIREFGFWLIAKPGPFVHFELNVGGLPDLVCPSYNPGVPPARRHHGRPAVWTYDASQLPAPLEPTFDNLAREWLEAVGEVLRPYCAADGPIVALQMNDETLYCTSNDPPWHIGFEPTGVQFYQDLMRERYGDIATYNRLHGTAHVSFDFVRPPALPRVDAEAGPHAPPQGREDLLRFIDWAEHQWRLRRDLYVRYAEYLDIDLPYLTNYAGLTPPIDENVPDLQDSAKEPIPHDFVRLYPEWWFAMNRIERDAADYHYGMISWLGVAAYDREIFDRYVNTARRARGPNMEENWGFGTLYDPRSRHAIVPVYQTLVSLAAGASGYVVFTGTSSDHWDATLDRITKLQHPTFPSHAPIDEHGACRPMYRSAQMLNRWFARHGEALLTCRQEVDAAYLLYAPYAAVSSWIPDERYWRVPEASIPRCGREGCEEFSRAAAEGGYGFAMFELDAAPDALWDECKSVAMHLAFFMDDEAQERLAAWIERGGRAFLSGPLPEVDLTWQPCTVLKDAVRAAQAAGNPRVVYRETNLFADGQFAEQLAAAGLQPRLRVSPGLRAFLHRGPEDDFVFFFHFEGSGPHGVEYDGLRIDLRLGPKTCGVLRLQGERIVAHVVKGHNEVEEIEADVEIRLGGQTIQGRGDFSSEG